MARGRRDFDHDEAMAARAMAATVVDAIDPLDLVNAIKRKASLRGMIAGYVAEEMFEKHVRENLGLRYSPSMYGGSRITASML